MNKLYIGIDPGQSGGIALIQDGKEPVVYPMPLIEKTELDIVKIFDIITQEPNCHIVIEDVHSIFGSSANSNWSFGFGCGQLFAMLKLSSLPFTRVSPKTWQKEMWQGVVKQDDNKATSLLAATRLFPNVDFRATERSKVAHDGIVDALLIAEYARRKNL